MPQPVEFIRQFAHLVWLLVHRPASTDEQKGALRRALAETRAGPLALSFTDLNRFVAAVVQIVPEPVDLAWMTELATRMGGHSVSLVSFSIDARAADVLGVARALAIHPVHGDEGAAFDARIVALGATSVSARLGRAGFVRGVTPTPAMRVIGAPPARTPPLSVAIFEPAFDEWHPSSNGHRTPTPVAPATLTLETPIALASPVPVNKNDEGRAIETLFTAQTGPRRADALYARLDADESSIQSDPRLLDELSRLVEESARDGLWVEVAEAMSRILAREETVRDVDLKRAFLIHFRRLFKPGILRGIAQLLPGHREIRESVQQVLARTGEPGADVLIELLVGSEQSTERRAYRSAIARCPAAGTAVAHLLLDPRWYVVRNAAELLGEMQIFEADSRLAATMRHSDARVRRSAAKSLGRLATARSLHALQRALEDPSAAVRRQAVLGLSAARNVRSAGALLKALDAEEDVELQHEILAALGNHPTVESVDRLAIAASPGSLLHRRPTAFRLAAAQALSDAGTHAALGVLRSLLNDKDDDVRAGVDRLLTERVREAPAGRTVGAARR